MYSNLEKLSKSVKNITTKEISHLSQAKNAKNLSKYTNCSTGLSPYNQMLKAFSRKNPLLANYSLLKELDIPTKIKVGEGEFELYQPKNDIVYKNVDHANLENIKVSTNLCDYFMSKDYVGALEVDDFILSLDEGKKVKDYFGSYFKEKEDYNIMQTIKIEEKCPVEIVETPASQVAGYVIFPEKFPAPQNERDREAIMDIQDKLSKKRKLSTPAAANAIINMVTPKRKFIRSGSITESQYMHLNSSSYSKITISKPYAEKSELMLRAIASIRYLYYESLKSDQPLNHFKRKLLNEKQDTLPFSKIVSKYPSNSWCNVAAAALGMECNGMMPLGNFSVKLVKHVSLGQVLVNYEGINYKIFPGMDTYEGHWSTKNNDPIKVRFSRQGGRSAMSQVVKMVEIDQTFGELDQELREQFIFEILKRAKYHKVMSLKNTVELRGKDRKSNKEALRLWRNISMDDKDKICSEAFGQRTPGVGLGPGFKLVSNGYERFKVVPLNFDRTNLSKIVLKEDLGIWILCGETEIEGFRPDAFTDILIHPAGLTNNIKQTWELRDFLEKAAIVYLNLYNTNVVNMGKQLLFSYIHFPETRETINVGKNEKTREFAHLLKEILTDAPRYIKGKRSSWNESMLKFPQNNSTDALRFLNIISQSGIEQFNDRTEEVMNIGGKDVNIIRGWKDFQIEGQYAIVLGEKISNVAIKGKKRLLLREASSTEIIKRKRSTVDKIEAGTVVQTNMGIASVDYSEDQYMEPDEIVANELKRKREIESSADIGYILAKRNKSENVPYEDDWNEIQDDFSEV